MDRSGFPKISRSFTKTTDGARREEEDLRQGTEQKCERMWSTWWSLFFSRFIRWRNCIVVIIPW